MSWAVPVTNMPVRGLRSHPLRSLRQTSAVQLSVVSPGPASSALLAHGLSRTQGQPSPVSSNPWRHVFHLSRSCDRRRTAAWCVPFASCAQGPASASRGGSRVSGRGSSSRRGLGRLPQAVSGGSGGGGSGASQGRIASEVRTPNGSIQWGCYLSRRSTLEDAVDECIAQIGRSTRSGCRSGSAGGTVSEPQPELAIVFVSAAFGSDFDRLVPLLRERLPSLRHIFGCSAFGVLGGGRSGTTEADGEPALSLTLGSLPGVDVRVFHTLRSSVPEEDAAVERWAEFVGVPADTNRHVSFLMFSDPRFTQLYNILEGLDYSFPRAAKLGGMLSVGVRSRQRAMFAWSARQDVRTRVKPRAAAAAAAAAAAVAASGPDADADVETQDKGGGGGWFQRSLSLISKLTGQGSGGGGGGGGRREGGLGSLSAAFGGGSSSGGNVAAAADDDSETVMSNGMYLYGAVCLVLHGDVKLDAIVSQGYRAPSPTVWRVEATTAGMSTGSFAPAGHILTISDAREAPPTPLPPSPPSASPSSSPGSNGGETGAGGSTASATLPPSSSASLLGTAAAGSGSASPASSSSSSASSSSSGGAKSRGMTGRGFGGGLSSFLGAGGGAAASRGGGRGRGAAADDDSDDDDDDDSDDEGMDEDELAAMYKSLGVSGTPSLAAIIDVVEALGSESAAWEEVMETCAVAVAADTTKPLEELGPADWEIMELKGVDQEYGTIMVDGEVRRGYRIKVMVRDPPGLSEDLRAQLLAYKREELRRVLSGAPLPPSFGALVFTDVERTPTSSGSEVSESELINSYLPLPTGGMFGGAQIAPLPGGTELVEYSSVIGVLRAMNALPPEPLRSRDEDASAGSGVEGSGSGSGSGSGNGRKARDEDGGSGSGGGSGGGGRRRGGDGGGKGGGGGRRFGGGGSTRIHRGRSA